MDAVPYKFIRRHVTALVELDNFKGGYLIASPEVPETEESNGKCDIKALSAVVFMEK